VQSIFKWTLLSRIKLSYDYNLFQEWIACTLNAYILKIDIKLCLKFVALKFFEENPYNSELVCCGLLRKKKNFSHRCFKCAACSILNLYEPFSYYIKTHYINNGKTQCSINVFNPGYGKIFPGGLPYIEGRVCSSYLVGVKIQILVSFRVSKCRTINFSDNYSSKSIKNIVYKCVWYELQKPYVKHMSKRFFDWVIFAKLVSV